MCSCSPGYSGHPIIGCSPSHTTQCVANDDCDADRVCAKQQCVNPCAAVCGPNTVCHMTNHVAMCSCSPGYSGHPIIGCSPSPMTTTASPAPLSHKRFYLHTTPEKKDWIGAFLYCLRNNSQLATIDNTEELEEVRHLIGETGITLGSFWVSGTDQDSEGDFIWASNGRPLDTSSNLWLPGEPSNYEDHLGTENCVNLWERALNQGYALNDLRCGRKSYFVCQYFV